VIYSKAPGGLVTRTKYDGFGNVLATYSTDGNGGAPTANADDSSNITDLASDHVLNEVDTQYDANDNVIFTINKDRSSNAGAATGALTASDAVISYIGSFYNDLNQLTQSVNYGSGTAMTTRPASPPTASSTSALLTSETYVANTNLVDTATDVSGNATKYSYSPTGQVLQTIQDYRQDSNGSGATKTDQHNHTTIYTYWPNNHVKTILIKSPASGTSIAGQSGDTITAGTDQLTTYIEGSSGINNGRVTSIQYPAPGDASPPTEAFTYDSAGDVLTATQRDGTVHSYAYNALGENISDSVTIPSGSAVDGTVTSLTYAYDVSGHVVLASSWGASTTTPLNQVKDVYNGLGQLATEYQEHSGAVTLATSLEIGYSYTSLATGALLQSVTYPSISGGSPRVLTYNYSGSDAVAGRPTSLSDSATSGTLALQSYTYQGLNTLMGSYLSQPNITEAIAINSFGEAQNINWTQPISGVTTSLDQFAYTYNDAGNVLTRNDLNNTADSETYGYDSAGRQTSFTVAGSSTGTSPLPSSSTWTVDSNGNRYGSNYGNAYTISGESTSETYSLGGYATTVNLGATGSSAGLIYNAWGRVVFTSSSSISNTGTTTYVNTAEVYDALGRQITQTVDGTTTQIFYSGNNVIEERTSGGTVVSQYVWSGASGNRLVLRDQPGTTVSRIYALTDAAGSVTSIVGYTHFSGQSGTTWQLLERYLYTTDGQPTAVQADWTADQPVHGDTNSSDAVAYSIYGWNYLFHGMRFEKMTADDHTVAARAGFYLTGDFQLYDPQHGVMNKPDPAGEANGNGYNAGDLSLYDRTVLFAAPLAAGAAVAIATGGLGLIPLLAGGTAAGLVGGFDSGYIQGHTGWRLAGDTAIGGAAGGAGGAVGGAVLGAYGTSLSTALLAGAAGGATAGGIQGSVEGYWDGGWNGALNGGIQGAFSGALQGAALAGLFYGASLAIQFIPRATIFNDLTALRNRIDIYAERALDYAVEEGIEDGLTRMENKPIGDRADRYFRLAVRMLNNRLVEAGSAYRAIPQFARTARGVNIVGGARPLGSGVLDAAITDINGDVVYSGWDITVSANWNSAATTAKYLRLFSPQEGFIREFNPALWRP
jgi:YD repeat-containing protein